MLKCSEWRKINSVTRQTIPNINDPFREEWGPDGTNTLTFKQLVRMAHSCCGGPQLKKLSERISTWPKIIVYVQTRSKRKIEKYNAFERKRFSLTRLTGCATTVRQVCGDDRRVFLAADRGQYCNSDDVERSWTHTSLQRRSQPCQSRSQIAPGNRQRKRHLHRLCLRSHCAVSEARGTYSGPPATKTLCQVNGRWLKYSKTTGTCKFLVNIHRSQGRQRAFSAGI